MDDLIERYLQAIGFWLPDREDILAELSEDLHSQIADEQGVLGRPLTNIELEALLKRRGRPVLIANGFRSQLSLIGPPWFPIYVLVLKIVMIFGVLPWVGVWFIIGRIQRPEVHWAARLIAAGGTLWSTAFVTAGVVTLIFAVIQWTETATHFLEPWSPRQLPPVRHPNKISLFTAVTELAINAVFLFMWLAYARSPILFDGPSFNLSFTPIWTWFFWSFLAVIVGNVVLAIAHLRSQHWTRLRAIARLLLDLAGGVLFCWLMKANLIARLYSVSLGPERSLALISAIHTWMDRCFPIALIIATIAVVVDMVRIVRVGRSDRFTPARALAVLIVTLLSAAVCRGQQIAANPVTNPSMPSDSELRTILADRVDVQRKSLGIVVALSEPADRRVLAYGRLNQSGRGELSGDTVFEVGSVTKIFTAMLLADMVQRGEVSLSDPVAKYLPSEVTVPQRNGRSITLLDLATQTSGLPFFPSDVPLNDPQAAERAVAGYSTAKLYDFVSHYQLTRDIGSKWEYSNLGFALLGDALARRAGMNFESLLKARITGPLGMNSTSLALTPTMRSRLATGYDANLRSAPEVDMPAFAAAGSLRSTANDLLIFLDAFLGKTQTPLAKAMQSMLVPRRPGPGFQQALGWWVISFGAADSGFFFHGGETPGFSSSLAFDPKSRSGVVVLSNDNTNDGGLAWHVMRSAFPLADSASTKARQQQTEHEIALDPGIAALEVGTYRIDSGPGIGEMIRIEQSGDNLMMKTSSTPPAGLQLHTHDNRTFFVTETNLRLKFAGDSGKTAQSLTIQFAGTDTVAQRTR